MTLNDILTQDLSDPSLTQMPVLNPGVYEFAIKSARLVRNTSNGMPVVSLRLTLAVVSPATKFQSDEIWPPSLPVMVSYQLTPTGNATPDLVRQNLAAFLQSIGEKALLTPEEAAEFNSNLGDHEMPLTRFEGRQFTGKVTVRADRDGNPRNNVRPLVVKK